MCIRDSSSVKNSYLCILEEIHSVANAEWSTWGSWTKCSVTCGNGTQSKSRKCETEQQSTDMTSLCTGNGTETQACTEKECLQGS